MSALFVLVVVVSLLYLIWGEQDRWRQKQCPGCRMMIPLLATCCRYCQQPQSPPARMS